MESFLKLEWNPPGQESKAKIFQGPAIEALFFPENLEKNRT